MVLKGPVYSKVDDFPATLDPESIRYMCETFKEETYQVKSGVSYKIKQKSKHLLCAICKTVNKEKQNHNRKSITKVTR